MSQSRALISADLAYLDQISPLPLLAVMGVRAAVTVSKWTMRRRTRKILGTLEPHQLHDIGVTRFTAEYEANKRFWQP